MTRTRPRRKSRFAYAAFGASILVIPATAIAAKPAQVNTHSGIQTPAKRRHIAYGQELVFTGRAPSSEGGQNVTLQFLAADARAWRQAAAGTIGSDDRFRLSAWLGRSGWLKATVASPSSVFSMMPLANSTGATSGRSSRPAWVQVDAAIHVRPRSINQLGARIVEFRGQLLPGRWGRRITLQGEQFGRWSTLAVARTGRRGTFDLRYRPTQATQERLRVRFGGDHTNGATASRAGSLTVYQPAVASWYNDAGSTACGFHAYHGVASPSIPCGTPVTFMYGGRRVHAVVDDRGPFVPGRAWDLNQNTAAALGFGGVDTVWSSH